MTAPPRDSSWETDDMLRRLGRRRRLARLVLFFESAWPAFWPPAGLAGAFLCAALLGLPGLLPPALHLALLVVWGLAELLLLARAVRAVRLPAAGAADRRLEMASGLAHRPLATLADRPAATDAAGEALWQAHLARVRRQIGRLRVGLPHPGLAARDPRALRGALVVALVAALVIAGPDAGSRLAAAFRPDIAGTPAAPTVELQAWVTPPAYTAVPPLFLHPDGGMVSVPAGSKLTVSVTGGRQGRPPELVMDGQHTPFSALDATSFQASRTLTEGGRLSVLRGGEELAGWVVTVIADMPPVARFPEPPGRAGNSLRLRLPWEVADDYGVTKLEAELHLQDRPDLPALVIPVPLPGGSPKSARGAALHDLTANPWAGLPVVGRLVAHDASGQSGVSKDAAFVIPERAFANPVARALIAIRKELTLHPEDRGRAVAGLEALAARPEAFGGNVGTFLTIQATAALLLRDPAPPAVPEAQARLWALALHLENGEVERSARQMEAARQALERALAEAKPEPATGEMKSAEMKKIEEALRALEQAIARHLQAMLDQARQDPDAHPFDPRAAQLSTRDIERMLNQIERAAREGKMSEAQQRLAELQQMLDRLRNGKAADAQSMAQRQRGQQQMGVVQDLVQRQAGLLDNAEQRTTPPGNPLTARPIPVPMPMDRHGSAEDTAAQQRDTKMQQALRRALGELMQQFGDLTGSVPPSLSDADLAMRDAARALGEGRDEVAREAEQRAVQALQKGGQQMGQSLAQQFGPLRPEDAGDGAGPGSGVQQRGLTPGQGGRGGYGENGRGIFDPLGREVDAGGNGGGQNSDVRVPEEMERQRARQILDELRQRDSDRTRPQPELDYLDRLLRAF